MNTVHREFLDLVADIRSHLEYQKALGVREIEMPTRGPARADLAATRPSKGAAATPTAAKPQVNAPHAEAAQPHDLNAVREELGDCKRCKLAGGRKSLVFGEGNPRAALVFVGEGPGVEEDQQGRPFVGEAGELLTDIIVKGMKLQRDDVYICNVVKCRPPDNLHPEADEIDTCLPFLVQQIKSIQPKVIITLGNTSAHALLKTKEGITKLRGTWHEFEGIPVMPTYHPAYLLRSPGEKRKVWEDIKKVMGKLGIAVSSKE